MVGECKRSVRQCGLEWIATYRAARTEDKVVDVVTQCRAIDVNWCFGVAGGRKDLRARKRGEMRVEVADAHG